MKGVAIIRAGIGTALLAACGPIVDVPSAGTTGAMDESEGNGSSGRDDDDGIATTTAPLPGTSAGDTSSGDGFGTAYEDDGASDDGCTFTCPTPPGPPGGGGGVSFECDLERQDCPEGEKCMPWANDGGLWWNATRCSPLDPTPADPGEPCQVEGSFVSGIDDCALGSMCQSDDLDPSDGVGTCVALCSGACADPDQACLQLFAGIPQCTAACDPLDPASCESGRVCAPISSYDAASGFLCLPIAAVPAAESAPCTFAHECAPGLYCAYAGDVPECINNMADGCCVPLCDVQFSQPTCPAASGRVCTSVGAVPGTMWEDLGICVLPPR
jgi:hypothetical protein